MWTTLACLCFLPEHISKSKYKAIVKGVFAFEHEFFQICQEQDNVKL